MPALTLLIDEEQRQARLALNTQQVFTLPSPVRGETWDVTAAIIKPIERQADGRLYEVKDTSTGTISIAVGSPLAAVPTAGAITLTWDGDETAQILLADSIGTINTKVNALASIIAAGGVTVTAASDSAFDLIVTWDDIGVRDLFTADASNCYPESDYTVEHVVSHADLREQQRITVRVESATKAALEDNTGAVTPSVTVLNAGGAGVNQKVKVTFSAIPYDGKISLHVGGMETELMAWNATAEVIQAKLEALQKTYGTLVSGARYKILDYVEEGLPQTSGALVSGKKYKIKSYAAEGVELTSGALVSGRRYRITNYVEEGALLTSGALTNGKRYKIKAFNPLGPALISGALVSGKQYKVVEYVQEGADITFGALVVGKLYKIKTYMPSGAGGGTLLYPPGPLVTGTLYEVMSSAGGQDFLNVGLGTVEVGARFRATGTTPTTWTGGTSVQSIDDFVNAGAGSNASGVLFRATNTTPAGWDDGSVLVLVDDFINVGGSNLEGETFTATGTTPTNWTNNSILKRLEDFSNIGAMNVEGEVFLTTGTTPTSWTGGSVLHLVDDFLNLGALANATGTEFVATGTTANNWTNLSVLESVDDFRNVGALINESGIIFTATGTTPTTWVNGSTLCLIDDFTNLGASANLAGVVFTSSGTTPSSWTAGSTLTSVGIGNVTAERSANNTILIGFKGDMAESTMTVTASAVELTGITGKEGTLSFRTPGVRDLLDGEESVEAIVEIRYHPAVGEPYVILRDPVIILESVDDDAAVPDVAATAVGGIAVRSDITALTGGTSVCLDSIPTADCPLAILINVTGAPRVWEFVTSGAAEDAPGGIVRPDDYTTKLWRSLF